MVLIPTKRLNESEIPAIAVGTLALHGEVLSKVVKQALLLGYRHFDTATIYKNESDLGKALQESTINRKDLFITSKLWLDDQGPGLVRKAVSKSLRDLQTDYLDLYLIHRPKGQDSVESWKTIIELKKEGLLKHIGVSNFSTQNLEKLYEATKIKPEVNQVEYHVFFQDNNLKEYCNKNGIILEAYAPLASSEIKLILTNETLLAIGEKHNTSATNIALAWLLQEGFIILPRTSKPERLRDNLEALMIQLDQEDLKQIHHLNLNKRVFGTHENQDL